MASPHFFGFNEDIHGNGRDRQPHGESSNLWDCIDPTNQEIQDFREEVNELGEQLKVFREGLKEFKEDVKLLNKDLQAFSDNMKDFRDNMDKLSDDSGIYRIRLCTMGH